MQNVQENKHDIFKDVCFDIFDPNSSTRSLLLLTWMSCEYILYWNQKCHLGFETSKFPILCHSQTQATYELDNSILFQFKSYDLGSDLKARLEKNRFREILVLSTLILKTMEWDSYETDSWMRS